jgi:hypothetical protein
VKVERKAGKTYRVRACYVDGTQVTNATNNGFWGCKDSREIDINGNTVVAP